MRLKLRMKKLELARAKAVQFEDIKYCWQDGVIFEKVKR